MKKKRTQGDMLGKIIGDRIADRPPRPSRAKKWTEGTLSAAEHENATRRRIVGTPPAEGERLNPLLFPIVESIMRDVVVDELADSIDPAVDRAAIIRAVLCRDFENELLRQHLQRGTVDARQAFRWLLLCRVRAAMNELRALADELGDAAAPVRPDDPRNTKPVPKERLWRLAHPGRDPKNTAEVSRWYAAKVCGPNGCDPNPSDPKDRGWITVNLWLFSTKFNIPLDELTDALP